MLSIVEFVYNKQSYKFHCIINSFAMRHCETLFYHSVLFYGTILFSQFWADMASLTVEDIHLYHHPKNHKNRKP